MFVDSALLESLRTMGQAMVILVLKHRERVRSRLLTA